MLTILSIFVSKLFETKQNSYFGISKIRFRSNFGHETIISRFLVRTFRGLSNREKVINSLKSESSNLLFLDCNLFQKAKSNPVFFYFNSYQRINVGVTVNIFERFDVFCLVINFRFLVENDVVEPDLESIK